MDGVTNGMTISTGVGWIEIGRGRKERSWGENMARRRWRRSQKFF